MSNANPVEQAAAVLPAGTPGVGADAHGARDATAAQQATHDPRVGLLLSEAFRHGKAIGSWKGAEVALEVAGVPVDPA
ncbi:hypothetical protein ACFCYB_34465 [Streptomyces sp. NPDC056309]|uniref:hypothetical protein n=1 Tax=unclassified Streptomyces TaxID=2593676 RepID=UPI0035DE3AF4